MKNIPYKFSLFILATFITMQCSKKVVNVDANLPPLNPSSLDSTGGTWKTILLSNAPQVPIPSPSASNSSDYMNELSQIKLMQQGMNASDQAMVSYWTAGYVLRWNETLRGLVAKYNLPTAVGDNNIYPIPSPSNPFNYPQFPFSNPPYAARAYAYLSAAQYDALVAAYYYKLIYRRQAPYHQSAGIKALVPASELPSYPSEAGVLAGLTTEMMKLLFPTELNSIQALAQQSEKAAILSGAASPSDINAGDSLGRKIADLYIARAKTDKAGMAVGNQTIWTALQTTAQAKGETPWISLELPPRPPMLPLFGNVHSLFLDSATIVSLRPGPPPSTSSNNMKNELSTELSYSKNPTGYNVRITQFWADGIGTYTPPGHWNYIASQDFIQLNYSEIRWARNLAFLNITLMDAAIVCWNTKYYYFNPRPTQLNPQIKTLTGIPNFPSYISGHSTFSGAACAVLSYIIPDKANIYNQMAAEASLSRQVSGIHYKVDCDSGLQVGFRVGNLAIEKLQSFGGN